MCLDEDGFVLDFTWNIILYIFEAFYKIKGKKIKSYYEAVT